MQQRCDRLNLPNMLHLDAPFLLMLLYLIVFSSLEPFLRSFCSTDQMSLSKSVCIGSHVYVRLAVSAVCEKGFYLGAPVRGVIEMSLIFWMKSIWDIGTKWFVLHCAKFSIHCATSASNYVAPETTVVLVTSSLLVCYILSGGKIEYLLERLVERLNFVSGEIAELQYKPDLLRLDTRPVCYYVIDAWPCFCLYEHVYLISDFLMYSSIAL